MANDVLKIIDQLNERTRWAYGILSMISQYGELADDDVKESAACAARQIEDARGLLRELLDLTRQSDH